MELPIFGKRLGKRLTCLLWLSCFARFLSAQSVGGAWETHFEVDGLVFRDRMGTALEPAGDVNGDGFPDILIGAPFANLDQGQVEVRSAPDGALIRRIDGSSAEDHFGTSLAALGDLDSDGFADFAVGAPQRLQLTGGVTVISGRTFAILYEIGGQFGGDRFGTSIAAVGDVNQDSYQDFVVGSPGASNGISQDQLGGISLHSGFDGSMLWRRYGPSDGSLFGQFVSAHGDANGDSQPDLLVGAPNADPMGFQDAGAVYVYSATSARILATFFGQAAFDHLGPVSFAGDIDRDGRQDLLVGAPGVDLGGMQDVGQVAVLSGRNGDIIWEYYGDEATARLGTYVAGGFDVNADLIPDFMFQKVLPQNFHSFANGTVYLYSGKTGQCLQTHGDLFIDPFGYQEGLAFAGDLDGDQVSDFMFGANMQSAGDIQSGAAYVHGLDPYLLTNRDAVSVSMGDVITYALEFPDSEAGLSYALLLSASGIGPTRLNGVEVPLTQDAFFDLMVSGQAPANFIRPYGTLNASGDALCEVRVPANTPIAFGTYYFAAVSYQAPVTVRLSSVAIPLEVRF